MVDCSHANSGKDHLRQGEVCRTLLDQVRGGRNEVAGLLLESHLQPGRQDLRPGQRPRPDQSITDACIGWEETATLLQEAVEAVRSRLG
jgi:3-deoxy-7-phosphoheptulonate synthase